MSTHWNVQINIQRVETYMTAPNAGRVGLNEALIGEKRVIHDVLKLAVSAETEGEAYDKAHRMLEANRPAESLMPGKSRSTSVKPQA